jgi:hypothetical protein
LVTERSLPPQAVPAFRSAACEPLPEGQLLLELARDVARYPAAVDESLDYLTLLFREFSISLASNVFAVSVLFSVKSRISLS